MRAGMTSDDHDIRRGRTEAALAPGSPWETGYRKSLDGKNRGGLPEAGDRPLEGGADRDLILSEH